MNKQFEEKSEHINNKGKTVDSDILKDAYQAV